MSALNHQMLAVVCVIIALGVIGLPVALRERYQAMKLRTSMSTPNQVREIRSPAEAEKRSNLRSSTKIHRPFTYSSAVGLRLP